MTTEQQLREALEDADSFYAKMSPACQDGLVPRCQCEKCNKRRRKAALALPPTETRTEYRLAWDYRDLDGTWTRQHYAVIDKDPPIPDRYRADYYRNVRVEQCEVPVAAPVWVEVKR